jgi:hypothetical protein
MIGTSTNDSHEEGESPPVLSEWTGGLAAGRHTRGTGRVRAAVPPVRADTKEPRRFAAGEPGVVRLVRGAARRAPDVGWGSRRGAATHDFGSTLTVAQRKLMVASRTGKDSN